MNPATKVPKQSVSAALLEKKKRLREREKSQFSPCYYQTLFPPNILFVLLSEYLLWSFEICLSVLSYAFQVFFNSIYLKPFRWSAG